MMTSSSHFFSTSEVQEKLFAHPLLTQLYKADHTRLAQGEYDEIVESCLQDASKLAKREILRQLAFVLLSGPRVNYNLINQALLIRQRSLILLLNDPGTAIDDIIFVLRDCYTVWKTIKYDHVFKIPENIANLELLNPHSIFRDSPEDEVLITHGGGYYHIKAFVHCQSIGYLLEGNCGLGLQVHVREHNKSLHYSNVNPWLHMDEPGFLIAKIKAKYLCLQNNNGYEAGLRAEYASYLQDVQVVRMPHCYMGNGIEELASKHPYSENPAIAARIGLLLKEFIEGHKKILDKQMACWKENFIEDRKGYAY